MQVLIDVAIDQRIVFSDQFDIVDIGYIKGVFQHSNSLIVEIMRISHVKGIFYVYISLVQYVEEASEHLIDGDV